jgi:hypothetical protein
MKEVLKRARVNESATSFARSEIWSTRVGSWDFGEYKHTCNTESIVKRHDYQELRLKPILRNVYITNKTFREWLQSDAETV